MFGWTNRNLFPAAVARSAITISSRRRKGAIEQARQFSQGLPVNLTFELDHGLQFYPVLVPSPCIEFRPDAGAQGYVAITSDQSQEIPDLFLALVISSP